MNYYVHNVPGRLRVKIPIIKCRKNKCREIARLFRDFNGIENMSVNDITGSVVINYDLDMIRPDEILKVLEDNGYFDKTQAIKNDKYLQKAASKTSEAVGKALFGWVVGKALEANGLSFLAVLI
jgi:hypothetical protein